MASAFIIVIFFQLLQCYKIIFADSAPYHVARQEGVNWYSSSITIKDHIKPFLLKHSKKIKALTYQGKTWKRSVFWNHPGRKVKPGPGKKILQQALIQYFETHEEFRNELKTDFEIEMEKIGFKVIYNLPLHPEFNPIEMCWGCLKNCVAKCFFYGRSMKEVEKQMLKAMNGGPDVIIEKKNSIGELQSHTCDCNPKGVYPELHRKFIKHAITEIQKFYLEKEGNGADIFTRDLSNTKNKVSTYHHVKFKRKKVESFSGVSDSKTILPTGKSFEEIKDD